MVYGIASFSTVYNLPRFFELEVAVYQDIGLHTINNTGVPQFDHILVTVSDEMHIFCY